MSRVLTFYGKGKKFYGIFPIIFLGGAFLFFLISLALFYKRSYCEEKFYGFSFAEPKRIVYFQEYSGKILILYFGYTGCPGVCSIMMKKLGDAFSMLSPETRKKVKVVMVAIDLKNDNPERLEKYVKSFNSNFSWKILAEKDLRDLANSLGIEWVGDEKGYIEHTGYAVLVDENGYPKVVFPAEMKVHEIASDIENITRKKKGICSFFQ